MNLHVDSPLIFRTKSDIIVLLLPCCYISLGRFKLQSQTNSIISWYILILFKINEKSKKPINMCPKPKRTSTLEDICVHDGPEHFVKKTLMKKMRIFQKWKTTNYLVCIYLSTVMNKHIQYVLFCKKRLCNSTQMLCTFKKPFYIYRSLLNELARLRIVTILKQAIACSIETRE